jgi:3-oxoacyl-[acyl-carrier protein] reductase
MDLQSSLDQRPPPAATLAIAVDGSDEASVTAAFNIIEERWGALDGFVNAAGFLIAMRPLAQTLAAEFDTTITGNLRTTFLVCKAAMALLKRGNAPSLINIASGLGSFIRPNYGPYAASKAGMIALTKTLALEHAPTVRAMRSVPAPSIRRSCAAEPGVRKSAMPRPSTSRLIAPRSRAVAEDIVGPVMFLLGAQSAYMTGQTLWVNGGAYMP